jgi:predicted RNA-binding protein with PUA-like domain
MASTKSSPKKRPTAAAAVTIAKLRASVTCWLVKSEPFVYSFDQLLADKKTSWDGVRNFEARNTMRAMKKGDTLLYYHSNEGKEIVGIARVAKEAYQDPTTKDDWSSVEIAPVKPLKKPVSLAALKAHPVLSKMALVKRGRISVTPITDAELAAVLELSATKL